jgi:hypothetical protein
MRWLRTRHTLVIAGLAIAVAINAVILILRIAATAQQGDLLSTTLGEGQVLYPIWKLLHHHPLYEWPYRENYSLTLYNAGFYHLYAAIIGLLGRTQEFVMEARAITFVAACLGFALFVVVSRRLFVRLHGREPMPDERLWQAGVGLLLWFGTASAGWWILAARPDIPGVVLVTAGLLFMTMGDGESVPFAAAGALAFFAAWTMKQSIIGVAAGVLAYLLVTRQFRRLLVFAGIYFGLIAVFLVAGSEQYRASIIGAAGIHGIDLRQSALAFSRIWASNPVFVLPVLLLALAWGRSAPRLAWMWGLAALSANAMAFITLGKTGAERNHAFEALLVMGLMAAVAVSRERLSRAMTAAVLASCVAMTAVGVAQLLVPNRFGRITLSDTLQYPYRDRLRRFMKSLPKPIYIRDEMLAQPWHTTDGQYPAPVMDHSNYRDAVARGVITGPGILEWVDQRRFATFMVDPRDPAVPLLRGAYHQPPLPPEIAELGVLIFVRDGNGSH